MPLTVRRILKALPVVLLAVATSQIIADPPLNNSKIGKKIEQINATTLQGEPFSLTDLKDKPTLVFVFLSFDCPVSNSYVPLLNDMQKAYAAKGVQIVGVLASDEPREALSKQAAEFKFAFPLLVDAKRQVVDTFKAEVYPEAFVLDRHRILRYRGRIDNAWAARLKKNQQTTSHDLKQAIDDVIAERPVREPVTAAIGCPISEPVVANPGANAKVTYHRDILPILQNHCQECHRPGQVGPFSLMTYKQAVNWASDIKEYTQSRQMPPWKAVEGPAFDNDRRMPAADIAKIAEWVDAGCPEGDPNDAPPAKQFTSGWRLGEPDLVLTVQDEFQLGPSGSDLFRCFVLPTGLKEDKFVIGLEVKPGNPRIVHHTLNFFDTSGKGREMEKVAQAKMKDDDIDRGPGYSAAMGVGFIARPGQFGALGGWAPGQIGRFLPKGYGYYLPKGSDLIIQTHYHRNGRLEKDRLQIGLYFAKNNEGMQRFQTVVVPGRFLFIPAGVPNHRVTGTMYIDNDAVVHNVLPHMHLLGKSVQVTMTEPDGKRTTLVKIDEWDYNWQETYSFREPLKVKAGTRFDIEAIYDNSSANPNNPFSPPRNVTVGEQTTNEMLFGFIGVTSETGQRIRMTPVAPTR
jgi:peroxiredoxin/mono/diheme cytochrome c family protein